MAAMTPASFPRFAPCWRPISAPNRPHAVVMKMTDGARSQAAESLIQDHGVSAR